MSRLLIALFLAIGVGAISAGVSPVAYAQEGRATTPDEPSVLDRIRAKLRERESSDTKAKQWFDNLDLDRNDEITKSELYEGIRKRFEFLDANGDGYVSKAEYVGIRRNRTTAESRFGELDTDRDGRLTMPEFASPADWRFDRIDRNLDGKISLTEAQRLFDRPTGLSVPAERGSCFYVDRQIVRVDEETAEEYLKKGYAKADCVWTPDVTEQEKSRQLDR